MFIIRSSINTVHWRVSCCSCAVTAKKNNWVDPKKSNIFFLFHSPTERHFLETNPFSCGLFNKSNELINIKTKEKETIVACKRFRAVSEQRTQNESQRPRGQNRKSRSSSFFGLSLLRNHTKTLATQAKTNKGELQLLIARHLDYQIHVG